MMTALEYVGGAAASQTGIRRARLAMAEAADAFALTCRNPNASPSDIARAERRLSDTYAAYGGLVLMARAVT